MSLAEPPSDRDRREWLVVCLLLAGALGVLGGIVLYGERVLGAAW